MKKVPINTTLKNGETLENYIFSRNWLELFEDNLDKEASWYRVGQIYYPELPNVSVHLSKSEMSCLGSHYLIGSSLHPRKYAKQHKSLLKEFYFNLQNLVHSQNPTEALHNPLSSDLIVHSYETFCLSNRKDLIDRKFFFYSLKYIEKFAQAFEQNFSGENSALDFIQTKSEIAYTTAEVLGHLRYGLKVCSAMENHPFKLENN